MSFSIDVQSNVVSLDLLDASTRVAQPKQMPFALTPA